MKLYLSLLIIGFISLAYGAAVSSDCEYEGHIIKLNEDFQPPGECSIRTCKAGGVVTGKGCPSTFGFPPCELVPEDVSKPYPDCCPHYINC